MYSIKFQLDEDQIENFKKNFFDINKKESFGWQL